MLFSTILHHYLLWHYTAAFKEMWHVFKNFVWFTTHFFSLPQLLKSFFSPWKRITEERSESFNLEAIATYIIVNLFSRVVGMILRSTLILTGIVALLALFVLGLLTLIFWIFAPACLIVSLYFGLVFLFA
jgi:hypothetical protein